MQTINGEGGSPPSAGAKRELSEAAKCALAEAEERCRSAQQSQPTRPKEINGRGGPEPTRYGDWEVKGIASDF